MELYKLYTEDWRAVRNNQDNHTSKKQKWLTRENHQSKTENHPEDLLNKDALKAETKSSDITQLK